MECATKNDLGDDDYMTQEMLDDFEPSEELANKLEEKRDALEQLEKDVAGVEDQVREMLKKANEQSKEEIDEVLQKFMSYTC